jgi:predicted acyltransferase
MEQRRFESIDQLRGFAILSMVMVNVLGRFAVMPELFRHARYEVLSFADAVAPFFFFVVGMGFRISWLRCQSKFGTRHATLAVFRRCAALMVLAIFVYHFNMKRIFWDALSQISFGCLVALPVIGAAAGLRIAVPFLYAGLLLILTGGGGEIFGVPFKIESASWPLMILSGSIAADWIMEDQIRFMRRSIMSGGALSAIGLASYFMMPRNVAACALIYLGCSFLLLAFFHYLVATLKTPLPALTTLGRNALVVYVLHYYIDDDMRRLVAHGAGAFPALLTFVVVFGASYAVARYLRERNVYLTV